MNFEAELQPPESHRVRTPNFGKIWLWYMDIILQYSRDDIPNNKIKTLHLKL